jgi:hypothetical protein
MAQASACCTESYPKSTVFWNVTSDSIVCRYYYHLQGERVLYPEGENSRFLRKNCIFLQWYTENFSNLKMEEADSSEAL